MCFNRHKSAKLIAAACILWLSGIVHAGASDESEPIALVVHPENQTVLDQQQMIQLYLNKISSFSNGQNAHVLHLPRTSNIHRQFCLELLNLSANQYQSYWSRMLFTGAASDLLFVDNSAQMLKVVRQNKNAVGYLPASEANGVRIIGYLQQGQWRAAENKNTVKEQRKKLL